MKSIALIAAVLVGLAAPGGGLSAPPAPSPADWRYRTLDLEVTIEPAGKRLIVSGRAHVELLAASERTLTLAMNARVGAMRFDSLSAAGATVDGLGRDAGVGHRATLRFEQPFVRGALVDIRFSCHLIAPSSQLLVGDSIALASWVEGWYPVPVPRGDASITAQVGAASGTTRFLLPPGWQAVSNGTLSASRSVDGRPSQTWILTEPVARSFAAGPYTVARSAAGGRDIAFYLLRADSAAANRQAAVLAGALTAMERHWGPYPLPGYGIAEIPEGAVKWAASSEQGFIMARSNLIAGGGNLPLFAHEAAHAWWGNLVNTTGPGSKLVSESLAQYGAVIAIEALEGRAAMNDFLRFSRTGYHPLQCALGYFAIWNQGGDVPLARLANAKWDHNLSDSKGHWFYHMLRQRLGDDRFFAVLRGLLRDHAGKALTVEDLRRAFIAGAPGDAELPAFMAQWLDRTGAPILDVDWWSAENGSAVKLNLRQRQNGSPFRFPLEVAIDLRNGQVVRDTIQVDSTTTSFTLHTPAYPVGLRLDPDHHLLFWRPEYGARPGPP